MPNTFKEMSLAQEIQKSLEDLQFIEPTEIQKKAIPLLISTSKIDFHGQAQTGTGKTLAFGIPLIQRIDRKSNTTQALIVAPTRELAVQIYESLNKIAKPMSIKMAVIYGGVSMEDQIRTLSRGVQLVVGTPGRLNDHLRRKTLSVSNIKTLVLDEADIMLDMGFKDEVEEILKLAPLDREIWLFSATVKSGISDLIKKHMKETVSVRVSPQQIGTAKTKQFYCIVPFKSRLHALTRFIQSSPDFYGFIFCQTKILTSEVAEQLIKKGYNVGALHGDMSQASRNIVIKKFKQQELTILVATDVAARGIDIPNITHVINYSIPEDLESYVHRVGRTGRAGKEGTAITFISKSEIRIITQIERKFGVKIQPIDVPAKQTLIDARINQAKEYINSLNVPDEKESQILELIQSLNKEQLLTGMTRLMYDKFISNLDLEDVPFTHVENNYQHDDQMQEISIDMGVDDGVKKEDVYNFIMSTNVVKEEQIKSIRVIKRRTFVKLISDCTPELLIALKDKQLNNRRVRVNLTCLIGSEPRPSRERGSRFSGRRSSGSYGGGHRGGQRRPRY